MNVRRPPSVFWDEVDGCAVVCDAITGELYELNHTAALLWDTCDDASLESLTARLAAAFPDQDGDVLEADTRRFVDSMCEKGLLAMNGGRD